MHTAKLVLFIVGFLSYQSTYSQDFQKTEITKTTNSIDYLGSMDVDGDGDQDIVLSKGELLSSVPAEEAIQWMENLDNEGFGQTHNLVEGHWGHFVIQDIDADGDEDIIYSTFYEGTYLLRNNGNADFQQEQINSDFYKKIILEDANADGQMDIVALSESPGAYWVLYSDGAGDFQNAEILYDPSEEVIDLLFMDYDQNGTRDAIMMTENRIQKLQNDGTGNFSDDGNIINLSNGVFLRSVDRNLDNVPDLVYTNGDALRFLDNDGTGIFIQEELESQIGSYADFELADINEDGDLDILAGNNNLVWYEPNLSTFNHYSEEEIWYNQNISDILVSDFNGDEHLDILIASEDLDRLMLLEHNGSWNPTFTENILTKRTDTFYRITHADMNNDNIKDIFYEAENQDVLWVHPYLTLALLNEDGRVENQLSALFSDGSVHNDIADLNEDGIVEYLSQQSQSLLSHKISSNLNTLVSNSINLNVNLGEVALYDFDLDGDLDILAGENNPPSYTVVWWKNVFGNFVEEEVIMNNQMSMDKQADITGDGIDDVVFRGNDLRLHYLNSGFLPSAVIDTVDNDMTTNIIFDYEFADAENDGDLDILTIDTDNSVVLHLNDGLGNFSALEIENSNTFAWNSGNIEFQDFNGDGLPDIFFTKSNQDAVLWMENLGNLEFAEEEIVIGEIDTPGEIKLGHFDDDDQLDILVASGSHRNIVLYNTATVYGCTDPAACNYNASATEENNTCLYGTSGCTDPASFLFDPDATCDDGTCLFQLNGFVFDDVNEDGIANIGEPGIANVEVQIDPGGISAFSDANGAFNISLSDGEYDLTVIPNAFYPFVISDETIEIEIGGGQLTSPAEFAMSADLPAYLLDGAIITNPDLPACENFLDVAVAFTNEGNEPFHGVLALEVDNDFQNFFEIDPIDSVNVNTYYFSFDSIYPGESTNKKIRLLFPNSNFIGAYFTLEAFLYREEAGSLVEMNSFFHEEILECSYDPNDKTVYPVGVGDEGYILDEEQLEYKIRFQNTGNAPAVDVVILDEIDINLDLESLDLVANSHAVMMSIDESTRIVQFLFDDIFLPDSLHDEPNSHGYVIFRIDLENNLDVSTAIENTASIYFDNNDPIVTNTVLNTIYECVLFNPVLEQNGNVLAVSEGNEVEWYLDGNLLTSTGSTALIIDATGMYTAIVTNTFDCEQSLELEVLSIDILEINALQFQLYPNPAESVLHLISAEKNIARVQITDHLGRTLIPTMEMKGNHVIINIDEFLAGLYVLRAFDRDGNSGVVNFVKY